MTTSIFVTVAEAADLLGVSRNHVYRMLTAGELPAATHAGRRKLVPREAIDMIQRSALDGFDPTRLAGGATSPPMSASKRRHLSPVGST